MNSPELSPFLSVLTGETEVFGIGVLAIVFQGLIDSRFCFRIPRRQIGHLSLQSQIVMNSNEIRAIELAIDTLSLTQV